MAGTTIVNNILHDVRVPHRRAQKRMQHVLPRLQRPRILFLLQTILAQGSSSNSSGVMQIRRSSYHDVVRVAEIHKVLDISGVQTYVINSARVLFLNERPQNQPKTNNNVVGSGKSNSHLCEICRRNLLDPFRFCSLGCKLVGIKKNGNASFVLSAKKDEEIGRMHEGRLASKEELREGIHTQVYQSTSSTHLRPSLQACSNSRRRKGVPHRAPLGP
ncbi:hypothetical protein CR513_02214 [Mucuna pruriens]|uniref:PLATZ transcription factor family protein n=1 Tax=Mucuna pruriens TaxID=157652 RepID=A0A371ID30_MUCPR|nr:hypothetical protein CR513_02214 [Mucuna pruriens]